MFLLLSLFATAVLASKGGAPRCVTTWPDVGQMPSFMQREYAGEDVTVLTAAVDQATVAVNTDVTITVTSTGGKIAGYLAHSMTTEPAGTLVAADATMGKVPSDTAMCTSTTAWVTHTMAFFDAASQTLMLKFQAAAEGSYNVPIYALVGTKGDNQKFYLTTVAVTVGAAAPGTTTTAAVAEGTTTVATPMNGTTTAAPMNGTTTAGVVQGDCDQDTCTKCAQAGCTWCVVGLTRETDAGKCAEDGDSCNWAADKVGETVTDEKMCVKDLNDACEAALEGEDDEAKCKACIAKEGCAVCSTGLKAARLVNKFSLTGQSCTYVGGEEKGCALGTADLVDDAMVCEGSAATIVASAAVALIAVFTQF